ncbi:MAG TPA: glycoside hydrolase family 13 protein [Rugosimonospora sp.]|nr:glycoside hydrolase family 13 protein [Rugosimonospora sp.]
MTAQPHHDGSPLYVSDPAPALGDTVTVWARVPVDAGVVMVWVRSTPDGEPAFTMSSVDRQARGEVWWRAEVRVRNPVTNYRFLLVDAAGRYRWLTALGVVEHDVPDGTDFRLVAYPPPPAWHAGSVVYQIFPDRFARSAAAADRQPPGWAVPCDWDDPVIGSGPQTPVQFYGGDLDGIAAHLDHIEALGCTAVYLTPVFPAPSNHRYNASSFDVVDPLLGGEPALHRLAKALHDRGIRLIGDLTTNHTGDTHPWVADPSLYYVDGQGRYESWQGFPTLPKLNWGSAELRRRFLDPANGVATRWLRDLDGWRVDVANMTGRLAGDDYAHEVAAALRAAVTGVREDALLVAEHTHDATGDLDRNGWHGTMNQAGFTRPLWTWLRAPELDLTHFLGVPVPVPRWGGPAVHATLRGFAARISWRSLTNSWNLLGSHDTPRIRTVVRDPARREVAAGLLATLPGVPMVFAGDELGLEGVNGEDGRRPMPWHRPSTWDTAALRWYRELIALRRAQPALRTGGLRWADVSEDALAFWRETPDQRLLVLARRAPGEPVPVPHRGENLYGGAPLDGELPGDGPAVQVWAVD